MKRETVVKVCNQHVLDHAAALFGTTKDHLLQFGSYEGCVNLVYEYLRDGIPMILRISYQKPVSQIKAELHFVTYLADNGVRVSRPVPSQQGNLIEAMRAEGVDFVIVSFVKGKGMRVPDNGYRYRDDAPIEEYFYNWGQVLGQMHALAKTYRPISDTVRRPERFELARYSQIDDLVPARFPIVRERFHDLIAQVRALPKDPESYGLIHGDFNDGNFTVDYSNGDITVFDFDDAGYFWFVYELACAWESGIGRTMFNPSVKGRQTFMDAYFSKVLEGYRQWNTLSDEWLARIPLFLKWVEMEEVLHFIPRVDELDAELRARLAYKIACVEQDLPYLGFFDSIYSSANPFLLV
jgi:Ser/Thr protein kinase RdoA (MazF antagonist)